jgi:hypothetical protein
MSVDMSESNENMDTAQHEGTYATFTALFKYGTGMILVTLVLMALFLL